MATVFGTMPDGAPVEEITLVSGGLSCDMIKKPKWQHTSHKSAVQEGPKYGDSPGLLSCTLV